MTRQVIILGTGGNCIDILDTLNDINAVRRENAYECLGFLDDNSQKWGKEFYGAKVLGPLSAAQQYAHCSFAFGIGSELNFWNRRAILARMGVPAERFEPIIHPTASVSRTAEIGYGSIIFQNVTITSSVKIGNFVLVLPNTVVSHDDVIGDYTCVAGGVCISGNVEIGQSCYLGTNCSIKPNVRIGDYCLLGMGSVVLNNVDENHVVVGNPARFLRVTRASERDL